MARHTTGEIPDGAEYREEPLTNKIQTGKAMYALVNKFFTDLDQAFLPRARSPVSRFSLARFFRLVREIPYRCDNKPVEVLARPAHILRFAALGMDCKKKAILIASWLKANDIPFRFIASSRRTDRKAHHVFPQGFFTNRSRRGQWKTLDATYSWYEPFEVKTVTHAEVLPR